MRRDRLLVIDCSGAACSAAVSTNGAVVGARFEQRERGHAAALMPQVADVMTVAKLGFDQLDAIVTTVGPGSFTGLRIGLSAATGLGLALGIPIVGLTTFDAHRAALLDLELPVLPLLIAIDSKRESLFIQEYASLRSAAEAASPPQSVPLDQLDRCLPLGSRIVGGDGAAAFEGSSVPHLDIRPTLVDAARIASALGRDDFLFQIHPARPLYLRPPDVVLARPV